MKRVIFFLLVVACVGALAFAVSFLRSLRMGSDEPTIVVNLPLTGEGSEVGTAIRQGAEIAMEELAATQPAIANLQFLWEDNEGKKEVAASIAEADWAVAVISSPGSMAKIVGAALTKKEIPHFTCDFEGFPDRSAPNRFGTWVSLHDEIKHFIDRAKSLRPTKAAVIAIAEPSVTAAVQEKLLPGLGELGITEIMVETITVDATDYDLLNGKISDYKPNLIIAIANPKEFAQLVPKIHDYRIGSGTELLTNFSIIDAAKHLSEEQLEGIRFVAPVFLTDHYDRELQRVWQFVSLKYSVEGTYAHAFGYALVKWLAEAKGGPGILGGKDGLKRMHEIQPVIFGNEFRFNEEGTLVIPMEVGGYLGGKVRHLPE